MTLSELISVHLGEGTTSDEAAALSRGLVSDPDACRKFVEAARMEGVLLAQTTGADDDTRLAATLEAVGIGRPTPVAQLAPAGPSRTTAVMTAVSLLMVVAAGVIWYRSSRTPHAGEPSKADPPQPPAMVSRGTAAGATASPSAPPVHDTLAVRAAHFYLPRLEFQDLPLDAVLEGVLAAVAEADHLQRPEFRNLELAWQPLDIASATSPPRVTLRQTALPLAAALEWIAILTDCRVQWHERGARLAESLPEAGSESTTSRTIALASLPPGLPGDREAADASLPAAADILSDLGLTEPAIRSARLDAASGSLAVSLTDREFARVKKILALYERCVPPPVSISARLAHADSDDSTTTTVLPPDAYKEYSATLANDDSVSFLPAPAITLQTGQPFVVETDPSIATATTGKPPDQPGLRLTGLAHWSGEIVRVSASVTACVPTPSPSQNRSPQAATGPNNGPLQVFAADLEAVIPPGHTLVFGLAEEGTPGPASLHLSVSPPRADTGRPDRAPLRSLISISVPSPSRRRVTPRLETIVTNVLLPSRQRVNQNA
jgi:hypothetical protein